MKPVRIALVCSALACSGDSGDSTMAPTTAPTAGTTASTTAATSSTTTAGSGSDATTSSSSASTAGPTDPTTASTSTSTSTGTGTDTEGVVACADLANSAIGYGRDATGGLGGPCVEVTTLADSGPGSLRAAAEAPGAAWIVFRVDGAIELESAIDVAPDKTIDGRNHLVTLTGRGLLLDATSNVIVENLEFNSGTGDGITVYGGTTDVWIDHCTFDGFDDGAVDITETSTDVTVSWSRFQNFGKVMLISASDDADYDDVIRVTSHHNFFDATEERHPRLRFGRAHAFNNLVEGWLYYGMRVHLTGQLVSENNIFIAGDNKDAIALGDMTEVRVRSEGDDLRNGATVETHAPELAFVPADAYPYELEPTDGDLEERLRAQAGQRVAFCECR